MTNDDDDKWNDDLSGRGEDIYGEQNAGDDRNYHNPRKPTFPIPYGNRRRDANKPPFDVPYAGNNRRQRRSSGFDYDDPGKQSYHPGSHYNDLSERGEDAGNRPVWERDRSRRAGFQFGDPRQEGPHRGKGPRNYQRPDARISDDVNDLLADDELIDASDIEVTVRSCEVSLSGTVNNRDAKRRAEDIAESVSGVKNVENRLRVQRNSDWINRDGNHEDRTMGTNRSNISEQVK